MSPINYEKIKTRGNELHKLYRIPVRSEWHVASAMEGGPVVPDAVHWRHRYSELAQDLLEARKVIEAQLIMIRKLRKKLAELGSPYRGE